MSRIKKAPKHWPHAPSEQQIEGLKFVVKQVANIHSFEWSLNMLVWNKFMTKSQRARLLKRYRKIAGISYDDWQRNKPVGSNR